MVQNSTPTPQPATTVDGLPLDYYRTNFLELLEYVAKQYDDLLLEDERQLYQAYVRLSPDGQKLYTRLISRKGPYFRKRKLHYPEIRNLSQAAQELEDVGLLSINPELSLESLLALFTKPEILQRFEVASWKRLSRSDLDVAVQESDEPNKEKRLQGDAIIYEVLGQEQVQTYKLCFFGNLHQELNEWVLRDLGLFRYETYTIDASTRAFTSREQIEQYLHYYRILEHYEEAIEGEPEAIEAYLTKLPTCDRNEDRVLFRRLDRLRFSLARQLERLNAWDAALPHYRSCYNPPARERIARILVKQDSIEEALDLCRSMLQKPRTEAEQNIARDFGYRTAKKHNITWEAPRTYKPPTHTVALPAWDDCVEMAAARHLTQRGVCYYVENALFNGLLGLSIWDILYAPLRGAFFHPFQRSPNGFRSPDFLEQREALFAQRWQELTTKEALRQRVFSTYRAKRGRMNPLVAWEALDEELLDVALERIPLEHCLAVFHRILADLKENRTGFADLVVFPQAGGYELVEVKGPGDRLQKNQRRWLRFFAEHSIPHQVMHVEVADDNEPSNLLLPL
ncbi:MAG: VRR-NUC domain-containing protein [Deltaproteobacteria bacterium]|nr:MAG: VRR-NUC domain-containing protein [Deltaproteobacteria bacterium]